MMPRFFSLLIVPANAGAVVFVKNGQGEYVDDTPFSKYCRTHDEVTENVHKFLKWEYNLPSTYKGRE